MRHERPLPGRPTPIETLNSALIRQRLAGAYAREARAGLATPLEDAVQEVVIADMVELLDQGRIERGYADIFDLGRAGYHPDMAATLGPHAAKLLAQRVSGQIERSRGGDDGLDGGDMEAA